MESSQNPEKVQNLGRIRCVVENFLPKEDADAIC